MPATASAARHGCSRPRPLLLHARSLQSSQRLLGSPAAQCLSGRLLQSSLLLPTHSAAFSCCSGWRGMASHVGMPSAWQVAHRKDITWYGKLPSAERHARNKGLIKDGVTERSACRWRRRCSGRG